MKALPLLLAAISALTARADLTYDIRETRTVHPVLGMKNKVTVIHVVMQGERVAARQNDIVTMVDAPLNLIALIDYRTETFATASLDEVKRDDDLGFDSIQSGIQSELVASGEAAIWSGFAVKRDILRTTMTGGEAPGEILITSDWVEDVPGFAQTRQAMAAGDARYVQQLEAEIQILLFRHPDRFTDGLKIRKDAKGREGFEVHRLSEFRLAPGAPMLEAVGPEYTDRPIMSEETELLNLNSNEADPGMFLVPPGFTQVDFKDLLQEDYSRRHF